MKFALFLVCALVAVQGFEARSFDIEDRSLASVIDTIKAVIEKIKTVIQNIASQFPQLLQNLKDKIQHVVEQIPELINSIKDKIQNIVNTAGEVGQKCFLGHREELDSLITFAKDGMKTCVTEAEKLNQELHQHVKELAAKAQETLKVVSKVVGDCVMEHTLNPVELVKCLKEKKEDVDASLKDLQKEVAETLVVVKDVALGATVELTKCVAQVQKDVFVKERQLVDAVKQCIADSV